MDVKSTTIHPRMRVVLSTPSSTVERRSKSVSMEWGEESFYHSQPNSDIVSESVPDRRIMPSNYPQSGAGRDMHTGCSVDGHYNNSDGVLQCRYGQASSVNKDRCMYYKKDCSMCDKLVLDGKEIN